MIPAPLVGHFSSAGRCYGWQPPLPDFRRARLELCRKFGSFPTKWNNEGGYPFPPFDQAQLSSCTSFSSIKAVTYEQQRQGLTPTILSFLFEYYETRLREGDPDKDNGASITDTVTTLQAGVCRETLWPYVDIQNRFSLKPPATAYADADNFKVLSEAAVDQTESAIKAVLRSGLVLVCGIVLYQDFESDRVATTGIVRMPKSSDTMLGGHAVNICGWDDRTKRFRMANSWGPSWGQKGFFEMPYDYILSSDLTSELYVLPVVSDPIMKLHRPKHALDMGKCAA